jgi:hypothetical protein
MTWFPLQAALKMSTLPGAIRATLDALLDHINPAPGDPTRPGTLTVWESRELLAAESGFSEITIKDHLKRLRGEKDLVKGQRVMVLKRTEAAGSHRAARYELLPAALDALVDPTRLEAFEARPPRDAHPYQRWRQWRASQMAPADVGESTLPQVAEAASLGVSTLSQLGEAASPELPIVDLDIQKLTTADAPAAPFAHAPNQAKTSPPPSTGLALDKLEAKSPYWCAACGVAIPSCVHRTAYRVEAPTGRRSPPALGVRWAVNHAPG